MKFRQGDRIKAKHGLALWARRRDKIGVILNMFRPPAHPHDHVDIQFGPGDIERGINVSQIEHVRAFSTPIVIIGVQDVRANNRAVLTSYLEATAFLEGRGASSVIKQLQAAAAGASDQTPQELRDMVVAVLRRDGMVVE